MRNLGMKFTEEQVDLMMEDADAKGEGNVYLEEFGMKICPSKD